MKPIKTSSNNVKNEDPENLIISDITSEKDLCDVFIKSLRLPKSTFNILATLSLFSTLILYVVNTHRPIDKLVLDIYKWSEVGFSFSTSILGFLIAGFAFFSAVSDIKLFTEMAKARHASGLSYLKYNILNFMYVFSIFLGLALISFMIQLFSQSNGPLSTFLYSIKNIMRLSDIISLKNFIIKTTFVFLLFIFFIAF
jgi:hypothetical protein